jgi:hypothetical protein
MTRQWIVTTAFAVVLAFTSSAWAQGPGQGQGQAQGPGRGMGSGQGMGPGTGSGMMQQRWARERMFGTRLMTLEERQAHMEKMWNAKTVEERSKIRDEHRKLMLERARQQQQTIDDKQDDTFSVPER